MVSVVFIVLYFSAPQPEKSWQTQPYDNFFLASWLGGIALHWVFWPFFLFLNVSLLLTDQLAKTNFITVSSWDEIHFGLLFPIFWWTVSIWRCSQNIGIRIWAALARLTTLAVFIEYGLKMIIRIDYPRVFFNCEELLLDYGSCF